MYNSVTKSIASKFLVADNSENHEFSPGGRWMSYTIGNNLFLTNAQGEVITVTNDTTDGIVNGQSVSQMSLELTRVRFGRLLTIHGILPHG